MANVKFVNLDEIHQDELIIMLDKQEHKMVPLSVLDFIKNMKTLSELEENPDPIKEVEALHWILHRSFPTIPMERIERMSLAEVQTFQSAVRDATERAKEELEEQAAAANPPQAVPLVGSTSDSSSPA